LRKRLTPVLGPIGETERKIKDSIQSSISDSINTVLTNNAQPVLDKVLPLLFEPLINSHQTSYILLNNLVKELKKEIKENKTQTVDDFKYRLRNTLWRLNWWRGDSSIWEKIVEPELYPLEENLRKLGKAPPLSYLSPYRVRWSIQESIEQLLKDAFYTIQTDPGLLRILEGKEQINDELETLYPTIARKFFHDSKIVLHDTMISILREMILTPVQKLAAEAPGVKSTLDQLDAQIPDTLKEFFSMNQTFDEVLEGVVMDVITKQVNQNKEIEKQLEAAFPKNSGVTSESTQE